MATQAERDSRLDELVTATKKWSSTRQKVLENQVAFAKRVLKGRTGAQRLKNVTVTTASELLIDEISTFLTG